MSEFVRPFEDETNHFSLDGDTVGLWINQQGVGHVGLTYVHPETGATRILDLLGSNRVRDEAMAWRECRKQYLYAPARLSELNRKTFPGYLANVALNAREIPFGIDWLGSIGSFDIDGFYCPKDGEPGLTCATFVSEIFRGWAMQVVDETDWPLNTEEGLRWRTELVASLRRNGKTPEDQIEAIERLDPVVRLSPADIAAAGTQNSELWPMGSEAVAELAAGVVADFAKAYLPTLPKAAPATAPPAA